MDTNRHIWQLWAQNLHRWGIQDLVASLLEGFGPLNALGAQMVYLSQPLLDLAIPNAHLKALADMLEDSTQTQAFVNLLREVTWT